MVRTTSTLALTIVASILLAASGRSADLPLLEVNAIVSQSGMAAFTGKEQFESLSMMEDLVNRTGGIRGTKLKIVWNDDESNPQLTVQLFTRFAAQGAPFVFGPTLTPTCMAALPTIEKGGPLMLCGSPGLVAPAGSYGFAGGPSVDDAMIVLMRYFKERGWTRIGMLASTDGSGQAYVHGVQLALTLPDMKTVQLVASERMNPADLSVAGQLARIKGANPQAILTLATGNPWGTMMHGLSDAGLDLPVGGGHGNINFAELKQYQAFLPHDVYFPGLISLVPGGVGRGPVKAAQDVYFDALKRAGLRSDLVLNVPWDPSMIVVSALRKLGPTATAQQLRDYIANLHGWVGINGMYDFTTYPQRGVGPEALLVDRYDNEKEQLFPVSRAGGYLK